MAMMDILSKFKRSGKAVDLGTFAMVLTCTTPGVYMYIYIGNTFGITRILMSRAVLFFSTPQHLPSQIIQLQWGI